MTGAPAKPEKRGRKPQQRLQRKSPIRRSSGPITRPTGSMMGKVAPKSTAPLKRNKAHRKRSPRRSHVELLTSRWAMAVKDRVGHVCELGYCGRDRATDAHHVRGKKAHPELRYHPSNGVALCRSCHMWAHAHPREFKSVFAVLRPVDYPVIFNAMEVA